MRRREFITLLGGAAAAWPVAVQAQQAERMRRIAVMIGVANDTQGQARLAALQKGMRELGWADRAVQLDVWFTDGDPQRSREYAGEVVGRSPDLIVGNSNFVVAALREKTRTIPIVFVQLIDPVSSGFVESLARPGGNVTGFISSEYGMGAKWLEILKDILPSVRRVGVLRDPTGSGVSGQLGAIMAVAPSFGVEINAVDVRDATAIERGVITIARELPGAALIVLPSTTASVHLELITTLTARHHVPAIYPYRYFTKSGGLISYGVDNLDLWRRSASYVDRILKGEKPADLPVQAPTKYELVINLKTAKALGLEIPPILLARADEVIE